MIATFTILMLINPIIPLPNIHSAQTAGYDYKDGPTENHIKHDGTKLLDVPQNNELYNCPKLITTKMDCRFHNDIRIYRCRVCLYIYNI